PPRGKPAERALGGIAAPASGGTTPNGATSKRPRVRAGPLPPQAGDATPPSTGAAPPSTAGGPGSGTNSTMAMRLRTTRHSPGGARWLAVILVAVVAVLTMRRRRVRRGSEPV